MSQFVCHFNLLSATLMSPVRHVYHRHHTFTGSERVKYDALSVLVLRYDPCLIMNYSMVFYRFTAQEQIPFGCLLHFRLCWRKEGLYLFGEAMAWMLARWCPRWRLSSQPMNRFAYNGVCLCPRSNSYVYLSSWIPIEGICFLILLCNICYNICLCNICNNICIKDYWQNQFESDWAKCCYVQCLLINFSLICSKYHNALTANPALIQLHVLYNVTFILNEWGSYWVLDSINLLRIRYNSDTIQTVSIQLDCT